MIKSETEEIKQLVEQRLKAIRAKDAERATSTMSADFLLFDVVGQLQTKGAGAAKKRAEDWFSSFQAPIGFDIHDLQISASDGVAFGHGLNHVNATKLDGSPLTCGGERRCVTGRSTDVGRSPTSTTPFPSM